MIQSNPILVLLTSILNAVNLLTDESIQPEIQIHYQIESCHPILEMG
jgi:hypothetical protein